ncbi:unnamed protein product [Lampetra planeri]
MTRPNIRSRTHDTLPVLLLTDPGSAARSVGQREAAPRGKPAAAVLRTPAALLPLPPTADRHPVDGAGTRRMTDVGGKTNKKEELTGCGKAPCAPLTRQKIQKAAGSNSVSPRTGRSRCIFTAGGRSGAETRRERWYSRSVRQTSS